MEDHDLYLIWNYLYKGIESPNIREKIKKREIANFKLRFPGLDYTRVVLEQIEQVRIIDQKILMMKMEKDSKELEQKMKSEMESYIAQMECEQKRNVNLMKKGAEMFLEKSESISDEN